MLVYMAELSHTGEGRSPNTVPLATGYVTAYAKKAYPDLEITIFRDPRQLLADVKKNKPDIVGFSVYAWSDRLSSFCAARVKDIAPDIITVAGGASIDDLDSELLAFLKDHPYYDVCCPNEGEISFVRLIEHILKNGALRPDTVIDGCARLSSDGSLLRGPYQSPALAEVPSPYLTGILDAFLDDGYIPVVQSMRGCPYNCKFCVSGNKNWGRLKNFDLEHVFAEIEYIKVRAKVNQLILTDENLGLLKDRDVALARYIIASYRKDGFPGQIYFYSAKMITDAVLQVVETLREIGEFGMSFQTLNEDVRKEIRRTNVSWDRFMECLGWAAERNMVTSTEMIFGFPGETVRSYLEGIESLLHSGVKRIYSYNLRLLNGIDLSTHDNRDKYRYRTRWRLTERTWGVYEGAVVAEVEEVVVGSHSFDYGDYKRIRMLGLLLEIISGRGYFAELVEMMMHLGMPGEKIVTYLMDRDYGKYPKLNRILGEYSKRIEDELFDSPEACEAYVRQVLARGDRIPEVKLNLIYTGKIVLDEDVRRELIDIVKAFIATYADSEEKIRLFDDYIDNILFKQIVSFNREDECLPCRTHIDVERLTGKQYDSARDLLVRDEKEYGLRLHRDSLAFIRSHPPIDYGREDILQDIYMTISRFGLMRVRETGV